MAVGRPHRIRITWLLTDTYRRSHEGRGVVAVAHGPGIMALLEELGIGPIPAQPKLPPSTGEILEAIADQRAGEVIVLPSDKDTRAAAEAAAVTARERGLRVAVVPTRSITQSLAAVAVHDPGLPFDDDVVAMSRAAGATRYGAVTVSTREAMTSAGLCHPGDILGIVDGDILEIGREIEHVSEQVLTRLLSAGGELATLVRGTEANDELLASVKEFLEQEYPGLDVTVYDGGQPLWPIIFGVE
jgi:dihydroxyacetone kinase-like predicted kinase